MATGLTGAAGVIGTMVGAYFGIQIESSGRDKAAEAQQHESEKAQKLAAVAPPRLAARVLGLDMDDLLAASPPPGTAPCTGASGSSTASSTS